MKLTSEDMRILRYFIEEEDEESWCDWEEKKDQMMEEIPLLRMYLRQEQELYAMKKAVLRELQDREHELEEDE